MKYKLKRSETFYIREGWFQKAINAIVEHPDENVFSKSNGVEYLGVGSNMVVGLKYWLEASRIIEGKRNELTEFGETLLQNDPYLENMICVLKQQS